jgi:hypothetical protein
MFLVASLRRPRSVVCFVDAMRLQARPRTSGSTLYSPGWSSAARPLRRRSWKGRPTRAPAGDAQVFAPFAFGNLPRVTEAITGPKYLAEDVSLLKDFRLTEKMTFQLKGEAFDVFNRHRMGLPDQQPGDSSQAIGFGIPGTVDYGPRNIQVSGRISF